MPQCPGIKRDGGRCGTVVEPSRPYCYHHDPATAEKRKRIAAKGGKSKPSRDLLQTRTQLQTLADSVLAGEVDRSDASVAGQLLNIKLRTIELERRLKETEDLERRLEELEESIEQNNQNSGGRRAWG
jgi:Fe-S-cluster containining protein